MQNDVKNHDFRVIFDSLRDLAAELWDAAERLDAAAGVVVDALNDTLPVQDAMLLLVTRPGSHTDDLRRRLQMLMEGGVRNA